MAPKKTADVIKSMLTENTGCHFLDSGGAYGRHWQRNQTAVEKDQDFFKKQPRAVLEFSEYEDSRGQRCQEFYVTINLYHFLNDRLEYDARMQRRYNLFVNRKYKNRDDVDFHLVDMEEFIEWLKDRGENPTSLYGEGEPNVCYSYNEENCLSQDIQFIYFELGDGRYSYDRDCYVLLQIHNGCDARGGLTAPKCFRVNCDEPINFFDWGRVTIYDALGNAWDSEHGYHNWENVHFVRPEDPNQLVLIDEENEYPSWPNLDTYELETNDKGQPLSPIDGSILKADFW